MIRRAWRLLTWHPTPVMILNVHDVTPDPESMTSTVSWSLALLYPRETL